MTRFPYLPWNVQLIAPFLLTYVLYTVLRWFRLRKIMPPGPLGLPWIGNTRQMPKSEPWMKFDEWTQRHGCGVHACLGATHRAHNVVQHKPSCSNFSLISLVSSARFCKSIVTSVPRVMISPVSSIMLGSKPVIVLGTAQAAWDLLEKRSDIYSSRPRSIMAGEILSDNKRGLLLQYNDAFRKWRKVLHSGLHSRQSESYTLHQTLESCILMKDLLDNPKEYMSHLLRFSASIVLSLSYGRRVATGHDSLVKENRASVEYMFRVSQPGKYIVESWPLLLKLPRSCQWFRREADERRQKDIQLLMGLYNEVKDKVSNGTAKDCLVSQSVANFEKTKMEELDLAYAIASPFSAGIETVVGTVMTLMVSLVLHPEVKRKVVKELESVVGWERMPDFDDRAHLPYLTATIKESMRWRPVAVMGGAPHAVITDDVYNGMFIPKDSTVIANLYSIMKDPELFHNPEAFLPERFMNPSHPRLKEFELPFGFGRRACPGIHVARNSVFIAVARMIWAFDLLPSLDENGRLILPDPDKRVGTAAVRPPDFDYHISPRSERIIAFIIREWESAKATLEQW